MDKIYKKYIVSIAMVLFLSSCSFSSDYKNEGLNQHIISTDIVSVAYIIADNLISNLKADISADSPVIVTTFSNINDLDSSTTFGKMLSEHVSSRFSQQGFIVREFKFRQKSIYVNKDNGEFMLSRDINEISKNYNSSAVIVGTYGESAEGAYVSARIINPSNGVIISSCDFGIHLGPKRSVLFTNN